MSEATVRSRKEDDVLQRSMKKVKESPRDHAGHEPLLPNSDVEGRSYRDKLVGVCPRAFEKAFNFGNAMEMEVETNDEADEDLPSEAIVQLNGNKKGKIQAAWKYALIVKVLGKTVGYHFLTLKNIYFKVLFIHSLKEVLFNL